MLYVSPRDHKSEFLTGEIRFLTLQAALSTRNRDFPVYAVDGASSKRPQFRQALIGCLEGAKDKFVDGWVSNRRHCRQIEALSDELSSMGFGELLHNGRFRIGVAQKALNLYLKYLWCLGEVAEPPHCPFDNIIISTLDNCGGINWTEFDDSLTYEHLVHQARLKAEALDLSLGEWELQEFNRR